MNNNYKVTIRLRHQLLQFKRKALKFIVYKFVFYCIYLIITRYANFCIVNIFVSFRNSAVPSIMPMRQQASYSTARYHRLTKQAGGDGFVDLQVLSYGV